VCKKGGISLTDTPDNGQLKIDDIHEISNKKTSKSDHRTQRNTSGSVEATYASSVTAEILNSKQLLVFDNKLENIYDWMVDRGKDPEGLEGLAEQTANNYIDRLDSVFRIVWDLRNNIVLVLSHDLCDEFCRGLKQDEITGNNGEPYDRSSKRRRINAIQKYHEYRADLGNGQVWDPPYTIVDKHHNPPDHFTKEERRQLREVTLEYGTIPSYSDCSPEQRDELKAYLAQKIDKPKEEVTPDDWKQNNTSWKIPSLIFVSLDTGFRPCEVERAVDGWVRLDKGALYIPKESASKSSENWEVSLREDTIEILHRWMNEKENLIKYDGRDELWLTREQNPYSSASLNTLLDNLCAEAGIDQQNRDISWMSIRHSVGKYMTSEGSIAETKEQLRHKSVESTLQYTHPLLEDRQNTLDKIG
jgi:integrase